MAGERATLRLKVGIIAGMALVYFLVIPGDIGFLLAPLDVLMRSITTPVSILAGVALVCVTAYSIVRLWIDRGTLSSLAIASSNVVAHPPVVESPPTPEPL